MATLSGNKIKDTYQSLVKFSDNGNITVGAKQLTDGFGNNSPMFVSTTQVGIGVTPEAGLNLHVFGDAKIGSNLTVIGNLVVEGSTTTVGTDTLTVKDPLIVLANNNTSTDAVDIGFYGKYTPSGTTLYSGLFREALTGKYRLFKGLEDEPTTTVNTGGTGYAVATLIASLEGNVIGNITGDITGNVTGNVTGNLTGNVTGGSISGTTGTFSDDVSISTDKKLYFNSTSNLSLYHDNSTNGSIIENSQGDLTIQGIGLSDDVNIKSADDVKIFVNGTDQAIDANASGGVELFYSNSKKLETTNTGISVTGIISNLTDPSAAQDAATKNYVDTQIGANNELSEVLANGNTSGANDIIMADGQKVNYGTDSDLEIYHDGTDGYVQNGTGNLIIEQTTDDGDIIFKNDNGSGDTVEYFRVDGSESRVVYGRSIHMADNVSIFLGNDDDGLIRYDSTANKILYTGTSQFSNDVNIQQNLTLPTSTAATIGRIKIGNGGEIQLYFDNTDSYLYNISSGDLNILSDQTVFIGNSAANETYAKFIQDGSVELYYNNSKKLQTTSTGITVTGNLEVDDIVFGSTSKAIWSNALEIYRDGNDAYLKGLNGSLSLINNDNGTEKTVIKVNSNTAELYYNNVKKLATTSTGIYVTGTGVFTQDLWINTGQKLFFDNGGDCYISEDTTGRLKFVVDGSEFMRLGDGIPDTITFYKDSTFAGNVTLTGATALDFQVADFAQIKFRESGAITIDSDNDQSSRNFAIKDGDGTNLLTVFDTGNSTFAGNVDVTSGASLGSGLQVNRTGHPSLSIITGGNTNAYIGIAPSGGTYVDAITISDTGNSTFAGNVIINGDGKALKWTPTSYDNWSMTTDSNGLVIYNITDARYDLKISGDGNSTFAGDVGIGINPSYKFEIKSSGAGNYIQHFVSSDGSSLGGFYENADTDALFFLKNASGAIKVEIDSDGDSYFNGGNVGIGTTSPDFTLDVEADKDTWLSRIYNTGSDANAQSLLIRSDATSAHDALVMGVYADSGYKMVVRSTGNVGIGTTNPVGDGTALNLYGTTASTLKLQTSLSGTAITDGGEIVMYDNDLIIKNREAGYIQFATTGTERMRITANGSIYNGLASNTHFGLNALSSVTTADESTAFGNNALGSQQTGRNTAVGYHTLQDLSTGQYNTAVGGESLENLTTANSNIGLGSFAGRAETTGDNQIFIGREAGKSINNAVTASGENVIIGHNAAINRTGGTENVLIGSLVNYIGAGTGNNNTVVGRYAGAKMTSATANTFLGHQSGAEITTGNNNVLLGKSCGDSITTGVQNICVGAYTDTSSASDSYSIVISTDQDVGKGSSTAFIAPNGGNVFQDNNSANWATTSDERIKKNIVDNNIGLEVINKIQIRNFEYRTVDEITDFENPKSAAIKKEGIQLGVIAQEIEKILPETITEESTGVKTVNSDNLTWYLINAVKELNAKVEMLEKNCQCKN